MTDAGRKDFTDKLKSKITPDSEKSTYQNAKDHVTDKLDAVAGKSTPQGDKSILQKTSDAVFGDNHAGHHHGEHHK